MKAKFQTLNPKNDTPIERYEFMDHREVARCIDRAQAGFDAWRKQSLAHRAQLIGRFAEALLAHKGELAHLITDEMGKPFIQAEKEVEKSALVCRYYEQNAATFLADKAIATDKKKSYISHQPLGPMLCIMPWNYPCWQVVRFAAPALIAGNTILLKHAENTTGTALFLEQIIREAGLPLETFQTLLIDHELIKDVIASDAVRAVTLTGSEQAGREVGSQAGRHLKRSVLELGGSDAYVVLEDADPEKAANICVEARLVNSGQSCVAAKRFIVTEKIYPAFLEAFVDRMHKKTLGDPLQRDTDIGPLAKQSILEGLDHQVRESLARGAHAVLGGSPTGGPGFFYPATVLTDVVPGMPAFDEELFGPVAAMIRAKDETDALRLANAHRYGLGGAIFSRDLERAERLAVEELQAGFVVVNGSVQSDPRLPFGGIKDSGYGRELSEVGIREFINVKTIVVEG